MLRKVILHGYLGDKYGKEHILSVKSIAEAMRALMCITKQKGQNDFIPIVREGVFHVVNGDDVDTGTTLHTEDQLKMNMENGKAFHIVPYIEGSGGNGVVQTVIGAVLIVIGIILLYTPLSFMSPYLINTGIVMMLSGIATMLAPKPEESEDPDSRKSFMFNGAMNTMEQGGAIALTYGRFMVGSVVIGSELSIEQI